MCHTPWSLQVLSVCDNPSKVLSETSTILNQKLKHCSKVLALILALLPVCLAAEAPSVTLTNAAKPGVKMPVTGIGT